MMKKISFKWRQDQLTKPCWAILKPEAKREKKSVNTDPFVFNFDLKKNYIKMFSLLITKFFSIPLNFVLQVSVSLVSPNPIPEQQSKLPLKNLLALEKSLRLYIKYNIPLLINATQVSCLHCWNSSPFL